MVRDQLYGDDDRYNAIEISPTNGWVLLLGPIEDYVLQDMILIDKTSVMSLLVCQNKALQDLLDLSF